MRIDIWADVACPWCWIGKRRFEQALSGFEHSAQLEVTWHSYQLDPALPDSYDGTERDYLVQRKGSSPAQIDEMFTTVAGVAAEEGLEINFDRVVVANSFRSHQLLQGADRAGRSTDLREAVFAAHFRDGRSISDVEELVALATSAGVAADDARAWLDDEQLAQAVRDDIDAAHDIGVQGVPFFVLDERYGVSGAQPTEELRTFLTEIWDEVHSWG